MARRRRHALEEKCSKLLYVASNIKKDFINQVQMMYSEYVKRRHSEDAK